MTFDEQLNCELVFLDLTHPNLVTWGRAEFCSFMGIVTDLTVAKKFTIVSVMEFGQQLVDFTAAVKEVKDARVIFECGSYECARPGRQIELARPCWQLVYAFVSLGTDDYKPRLVKDPDYRPQSCEIRYKTWQEEFTLDKGVGADAVNIKNKKLLTNFSSSESTVLDFFSGGIFTREALMTSRDVIYFSISQAESEFMTKYSKQLLTHSQRVREWFAKYLSKKVGGSAKQIEGPVQEEAPSVAEQTGNEQTVTIAALAEPFVGDDTLANAALERLGNITCVVHYVPDL
ncbi:hypothetical protein R1sor_013750 [Riccia sorocarpa]|uniref:Uncharacterized protein n=1 Tax=Riccia sorocarpa TaxID=122646 RepID=A0ABD3H9C6_9MARC